VKVSRLSADLPLFLLGVSLLWVTRPELSTLVPISLS